MSCLKDIVFRIGRFIIKGVPTIVVKPNIVELPLNKLLDKKIAIVTGGSSGIGFEIAKSFLKAGASVVITGRNKEKLESAVNRLKSFVNEDRCVYQFVLDSRDVNAIGERLKSIIELCGRIDILVNNAGVLTYHNISNEDENTYDSVLDTNLKGSFFFAKLVGQYFIDNSIHGNILNVGSSSSLRPAASAYTLSKWGIRGLTLGLAKTLAPYGITVNGIAPGQTLTSMVPNSESIDNLYLKNVPLGRYILPEEIGNMAVILVSDMARALIGDMIYMTGGAGILTFEDISYKF